MGLLQIGPLALWEGVVRLGVCRALSDSAALTPALSRRERGLLVAIAVLLAACLASITSQLAAEPILEEENLSLPTDTSRPTEEGNTALALFKVGDYESSLKMWQELAKSNADMPPAQTIMAQLYLKAEMLAEAQKALDQAIVDAPDDPEAYMLLAAVAMHDRDLDKADAMYRKAGRLISRFDKSVSRKKMLQPWLYRGIAGLAEARKDWAGRKRRSRIGRSWSRRTSRQDGKSLFVCSNRKTRPERWKASESGQNRPRHAGARGPSGPILPKTGDFENAKKWIAAASTAARPISRLAWRSVSVRWTWATWTRRRNTRSRPPRSRRGRSTPDCSGD